MRFGKLDGILRAKEIRRVQEIHMKRMTFDPLTAIEETTEVPDPPVNGHTQQSLHGLNGAHLIGHGADSADASSDVGHFEILPSAQKSFKQPWRLVDVQKNFLDRLSADLDADRPLALHAGERVDINGACLHGSHSLFEMPPQRH